MQITFDTSNPQDLNILSSLMDLAGIKSAQAGTAQPEVADNTGTTATGFPSLSPEGSGVVGAAQEAAPTPEKKERKPRKTREEVVAEEPVQNETAEPAEPVAEPAVEAKPLTLDEVRAALQQFTAKSGVPAGIELLKEFNAGRISELDASLYGEFVERCAA